MIHSTFWEFSLQSRVRANDQYWSDYDRCGDKLSQRILISCMYTQYYAYVLTGVDLSKILGGQTKILGGKM